MRIVHVTNYFRDTHQHVGGAEQACYRTALMARDHGHSVLVVTTRPDADGDTRFETRSVPILEDYLPGYLRKYVEAAKWYSLQYDPLASKAFQSTLSGERADVVHVHNAQFLTLGLISSARRGEVRTVLSIYDYWLFCPTVMLLDTAKGFCTRAHGPWCVDCLPPTFQIFQKMLLSFRRRVIDHYLEKVDAFHVLSEHSRTVLEGYGISRSRIHVIPLTLPLEFTSLEGSHEPVDGRSILFAGWLNERKGLHRLLEAMPMVLNEHPDARLTAIGGTVKFGEAYEKKLDKIIDAGGFRDRVHFTGHLPPSEIKAHIQRAAVVVIPEQYENMSPLLMIEAMAMGKPIVISR
ncbi:MAG: glycosyltransferase family 4 protein, partial [Deltaproteobacteria bacterium]|nr:glycosyltransferase family 4 protein [Deltaproteobacteria bacterium]